MRYAILAAALALGACGSEPVHYHTLAVSGSRQGALGTAGPGIRVGDVDLPPTLDRHSLVTRTGPTTVNVDQQEQWAAPLNQMMQQVLTDDLTNRLGASRVLAANDPTAPPGTRVLTMSVRQFIAGTDGTVTLDTDWTLQGGGADTMPHHQTVTEPGSASKPDGAVETMSRALGRLADRIASSV